MRNWAIGLALSLCAVGIGNVAHSAPAAINDDAVSYRFAKGDTLITFARKYLRVADDYRQIQRINRIADPHAIPVGTILRIPRSLLKFKPSVATLTSVRGEVLAGKGSRPPVAVIGTRLSEGDRIATGGNAYATMALEDGSRISLPSNSEVVIVRLRRYTLESSLDYDFRVERGGARSKVAPKTSPNDSYRMRTPKAVSAVRGTDFDTRYDETASRDFAEVVDGELAVAVTGSAAAPLPAGNGLAINNDGSQIREALLPPPAITGAGRVQNADTVRFTLPAGSAAAMRITIATDAGFQDVVRDTRVSSTMPDLGPLDDGNYFVRFRAISDAGLEGMPAAYAFKRRQNSVQATAASDPGGWRFRWEGRGNGTIRYRFQLIREQDQAIPTVDENGLSETELRLSDLLPGSYRWRVGALQFIDGEANLNWTDFETFTVTAD